MRIFLRNLYSFEKVLIVDLTVSVFMMASAATLGFGGGILVLLFLAAICSAAFVTLAIVGSIYGFLALGGLIAAVSYTRFELEYSKRPICDAFGCAGAKK